MGTVANFLGSAGNANLIKTEAAIEQFLKANYRGQHRNTFELA